MPRQAQPTPTGLTLVHQLARGACSPARRRDPAGSLRRTSCWGVLPLGWHCLGPWLQTPVAWTLVLLHGLDSRLTIAFWNLPGIFRETPCYL